MKVIYFGGPTYNKVCKIGNDSFVISHIYLRHELDCGMNSKIYDETGFNDSPLVLGIKRDCDDLWRIPRYSFVEIFLRALMKEPERWGISDIKGHVICKDYLRLASQNLGVSKREVLRPVRLSGIDEMTLEEYED